MVHNYVGVFCNGSNFDIHEPRKGLIVSFVAADVLFSPSLGGIYAKQQDSYRAMHSALKAFAPGREHIVPTGEESHDWPTAPSHTHNGAWAASDIAEKWWTELFLPGEAQPCIEGPRRKPTVAMTRDLRRVIARGHIE